MSLMDLTQLSESMDADDARKLVFRASKNAIAHTAAICLPRSLVSEARSALHDESIKIATVVNFPSGDASLEEIHDQVIEALEASADEVDMVLPYKKILSDPEFCKQAVRQTVFDCSRRKAKVKVIIESGELTEDSLIVATKFCAQVGADFVKTSTGKTPRGARISDVQKILTQLRSFRDQNGRTIGLKVSGGIRTQDQAEEFIRMAEKIMGRDYVRPETFRIGASSLLDNILEGQPIAKMDTEY